MTSCNSGRVRSVHLFMWQFLSYTIKGCKGHSRSYSSASRFQDLMCLHHLQQLFIPFLTSVWTMGSNDQWKASWNWGSGKPRIRWNFPWVDAMSIVSHYCISTILNVFGMYHHLCLFFSERRWWNVWPTFFSYFYNLMLHKDVVKHI